MESRRQNLRKVRLVLVKRHQSKANALPKANNRIIRESEGTVAQTGGLVLVKESSSNVERNGSGGKLEHERGTSPWKITKVLNAGLLIEVVMEGRSTRTRHVSPEGIISHHASTFPSSILLLTRVCPPSIPPLLASGPTFSAAAVSQLSYRGHGCRGKRFRFVGEHHRQSMLLAGLHFQHRRVLASIDVMEEHRFMQELYS